MIVTAKQSVRVRSVASVVVSALVCVTTEQLTPV